MQFGMGWGKGRRVITTTIAGKNPTRIIVDEHADWSSADGRQARLEHALRDDKPAMVKTGLRPDPR